MLSKNDITGEQPVSTCVPPNQNVNKPEEPFLSTNIVLTTPPNPLTPVGMKGPANIELFKHHFLSHYHLTLFLTNILATHINKELINNEKLLNCTINYSILKEFLPWPFRQIALN